MHLRDDILPEQSMASRPLYFWTPRRDFFVIVLILMFGCCSGGGVGSREAAGDTAGGGGSAAGHGSEDEGQVHLALPHRSLLLGSQGQ